MGYIYKITCPEGKVYIGQTVRTLKERLKAHKHKSSYCRKLKEAIERFGFENLHIEVLWEGDNTLLGEMEKKFIIEYNCIFPYGYNLSSGGGRGEKRTETSKVISRNSIRNKYIMKNGLLGSLSSIRSKISGEITSWRVSMSCDNIRRTKNFKTKDEAIEFQKQYTENPDDVIKMIGRKYKSSGDGNGSINKRGKRWRARLYENGKHILLGTHSSYEEAQDTINMYISERSIHKG